MKKKRQQTLTFKDQWHEEAVKLKLVFFKKLTINLTGNLLSLQKGRYCL